jgi:toxin ParE1/3/4
MPHTVSFAPEAEAQLLALFRYIAREASPKIAERYLGAVVEHCEKLESFPLRGTPRDDIRPGLRTIAFRRRITIAYSVADQNITILGITYGGQDVATLVADQEQS